MSIALTPLPCALPLSQDQAGLLARLADGLDGAGLWWLSGYAAGLANSRPQPPRPVGMQALEPNAAQLLTIVYGSQTGNAKRLAESLEQQATSAGLTVRLLRADAYPIRELKEERLLYIVVSTQGDGEPSDDARGFVEFITGRRAPALTGFRYGVLGLGDSSYPQFCLVGRQLDERLAELGGERLLARGDADLDLEAIAEPWLEKALAMAKTAASPRAPLANVTALRPPPASPTWTRAQPFAAELLLNQRISGRGSDRDVRHLELSLQGSGLHYEPGDALGVWPLNPPKLVQAVLDVLDLDGDRAIMDRGQSLPLREWLSTKRELTRLSRPFIAHHAAKAGSDALNRLLAPESTTALTHMVAQNQVLDLLSAYPGAWSEEELVAALRPLTPRLYSIGSSRKLVGDEAHLTVAHIEYEVAGDKRWGTASHFLARAAEGQALPVFIEHNERFRLPKDASRDVIMIGPGTGVAPFRGFVQERVAVGASGRNWLLFGNPHSRSDFLYQLEWQDALRRGGLHRLDLAFSRDQANKVYVQHQLLAQGSDVFAWLEGGAHLYVCGDATRMARDVRATLLEVIAKHGGKTAAGADDYLADLLAQGRYSRDVY